MPDLKDFINEFKHGFQQASRYRVQIFPRPQMIANIIREAGLLGIIDATLSVPQAVKWLAQGILAEQARTPTRGFQTTDLTMYGITEHFPMHAETSSFDVAFLMPHTTNILKDNGVPRFFNFWQNQIQNVIDGADSGLDFRFPSNYYSTILLSLLDKSDNATITYQFDNAYPAVVSSANLAWDQENTFTKLPVVFNFSYWKIVPHLKSVALSLLNTVLTNI
jgi:hypothetical protein